MSLRKKLRRWLNSERLEQRYFLSGIPAFAQHHIDFEESYSFQNVVDFDNDGDLDGISLGAQIGLTENIDGQFAPYRILANGIVGEDLFPYVRHARVADLDNDGDIDILYSLWRGGRFGWFENLNGDGSNWSHHEIDDRSFGNIFEVEVVDLDNNGRLDVVANGQFEGRQQIFWFENTDGAEFGTLTPIAPGVGLHIGDLDTDGDLDIVTYSDRSTILKNDGAAQFESFGLGIPEESRVRGFADIDSDGDLDILSLDDLQLEWIENDGNAQFVDVHKFGDGSFGGLVFSRILPADVDGDGDIDFITEEGHDYFGVSWFENANGVLLSEKSLFSGEMLNYGDFDSDGDLDFISTDREILSRHDFQAVERSVTSIQLARPIGFTYATEVGDIDGDGDLDLLRAAEQGTCPEEACGFEIALYENLDGKGNFGPRTAIASGYFEQIFARDMDGDGDLDIVARHGNAVWFENTDEKGSWPSRDISTQRIAWMDVGDLDGDGDLDLVYVDGSRKQAAWQENLGDKTFGNEQPIATFENSVRWLSADDLDGDSDLDVVLQSSEAIVWHENNATNFEVKHVVDQSSTSLQNTEADATFIGDLNGDNHTDILALDNENDRLFLNSDGSGNFPSPLDIDLLGWTILAEDLDQDGDTDLITDLTWYENSNGNYIQRRSDRWNPFHFGWQIVTGDLDGDGDLDIIVDGYFSFSWYENRPMGDVNDDGVFNDSDLMQVFQAGAYEKDLLNGAKFEDGDWNGDGHFDSADLVLAFQANTFVVD